MAIGKKTPVVGKGRRGGVLTAVERKSGYLCAAKLKSLQSDAVIQGAQAEDGHAAVGAATHGDLRQR